MTKTMRMILAIISLLFFVGLGIFMDRTSDMIWLLPFVVVSVSLATIVKLHP